MRPRSTGRIADLFGGVLGFLVLACLLIAVPYGLWWIGGWPWPTSIPRVEALWESLTSRDDGSVFIEALLLAGWIGWASFAAAVVVEIPAVLRGVQAPRVPGIGPQQRVAAVLVSATFGLLALGQAATAEPAAAAGNTMVASEDWRPVPTVPDDPPSNQPPVDTPRDETRDDSDSGDPENGKGSGSSASDDRVTTYEIQVRRGDTLWDLAGEHLDDPTRWPEIAEASADTIQPDGGRLSDPDLIYPGWKLTIPTQRDNGSVPDTGTSDSRGSSQGESERIDQRDADAGDPHDHAGQAIDMPGAAGQALSTGTPVGEVPSMSPRIPRVVTLAENADDCEVGGADETSSHGVSDGDGEDADSSETDDAIRTTAGVGAVLAAGVIALLSTRRALQQRRRHAGQRLPTPEPDTTAAETELRHIANPIGVELVDHALRALAARGQPLPAVQAARLARDQFELYLEGPAVAPDPWMSTSDGLVWMLTADLAHDGGSNNADLYPAPYPALLTVGHDADDAHVLLDLEHLGMLGVTGDDDCVRAFMSATAAELATSQWADDIQVTVVGDGMDLEKFQTGRIRHVEPHDLDDLLHSLALRTRSDRDQLKQTGANSATEARTTDGETWTPEVVLVSSGLSDEQWGHLHRLVTQQPRAAIAAVVSQLERSTSWALNVRSSDEATLEPLGLSFRPQQMPLTVQEHVTDLVAAANGEPVGAARPELALHDVPPAAPDAGEKRLEVERDYADVEDWQRATEATLNSGDGSTDRMLPDEQSPVAHPRVLLLGDPAVVGANGPIDPTKRGQATQVAVYLVLRPGRSGSAMDEAIWPGRRQAPRTRAVAISTLRRWLGEHPSGDTYLPQAVTTYELHPDVGSDWHDWRSLLRNGPSDARTEDLQCALELVRARPLSGVRSGSYAWADTHIQEMISEIIDVCHELAERALRAGDFRAAQMAAARGLDIEPGCELLWRDRIKAETRVGTRASVLALVARIRDIADELGGDLEEETVVLLDSLVRGLKQDRH